MRPLILIAKQIDAPTRSDGARSKPNRPIKFASRTLFGLLNHLFSWHYPESTAAAYLPEEL